MENKKVGNHHIWAYKDEIAKTVIMCGDPLRAKAYAQKYLTEAKLVCDIRGINIWTGKYNGHKVTVMGHGMGLSSIAIYAHELFEFFDVDRIIRLGSAATYSKDIKQGDIIIGNRYFTYGKIGEAYGETTEEVTPSKQLLDLFVNAAKHEKGVHVGGIYSSLWFYSPNMKGEGVVKGSKVDLAIKDGRITGKEMEAYILSVIANHFHKEALTVVTVIDNLATHQYSSPENKVDTSRMGQFVLDVLFK